MNLPGQLRLTTLGDVLGAVYREGATGVIELVEGGANAGTLHRIFIVGGLVGDVESPHAGRRHERLERLFGLRDARIAFRVRARPSTTPPPLEPREFLIGRRRARDGEEARHGKTRRDPVRTRALATLGLTDAADRASVQNAFRELARRMHPDRFPSANAAERAELIRRFAAVTAAYHALVA
jgi:hypothetical protein